MVFWFHSGCILSLLFWCRSLWAIGGRGCFVLEIGMSRLSGFIVMNSAAFVTKWCTDQSSLAMYLSLFMCSQGKSNCIRKKELKASQQPKAARCFEHLWACCFWSLLAANLVEFSGGGIPCTLISTGVSPFSVNSSRRVRFSKIGHFTILSLLLNCMLLFWEHYFWKHLNAWCYSL